LKFANGLNFFKLGPVHTGRPLRAARGGIRQTSLVQSEWDPNPDWGANRFILYYE